ncbi:MAG: glycosyltransferase family 39 protein [Candidatus Omnitrophica bacterium]|nr:glycosyltransferase family 39 protein [Candidatus Omnitrophota bacterium]
MARKKLTLAEQKEYIFAHLDSMSNKEIAKELGIPRDVVQKHRESHAVHISGKSLASYTQTKLIEKLSFIPFDKLNEPKTRRIIKWAIFAVILLLAMNLRKHTFDLPHLRGDQAHYAALAFNLDTKGIGGYSLRGVDELVDQKNVGLLSFQAAKDKGSVLKGLEAGGITYYDLPLHHIPWGFPMALAISHKIFAPNDPFHVLYIPNDAEVIQNATRGIGLEYFRFPGEIKNKQFYAVIVPFLFSLLFITMTYFLAKTLYDNEWIALTAMYLITISPEDLLTSQKVWADDMTAALTTLAVFLFFLAIKKKLPVLAFIGGVSCGLAAMTKQNGAFVIIALFFWHLLTNFDRLLKKETFLSFFFDKYIILFGSGALIGCGFWFYKAYSVYGNPFFQPKQANIAKVAGTSWFDMVSSRPKYIHITVSCFQNPYFTLALLSPAWLFFKKLKIKETTFLLIFLAVFLYILEFYLGAGGKEIRYGLPAYPVYAILGAYAADHLRELIDKKTSFRIGTVLFVSGLIFSAYWSIPMGLTTLFMNEALILRPF